MYTSGSGDDYFHLVDAAIRRLWESMHGASGGAPDVQAVLPRKWGMCKLHTSAGDFDWFDDREDVSIPGVPQPRMRAPRTSRVNTDGVGEDDEEAM